MGSRSPLRVLGLMFLATLPLARLHAQVLEFESGGLKYKALTRGGVTIMFAPLPTKVLGYTILQVAISNGSATSWSFKPEDFRFERDSGQRIQAVSAGTVVKQLLDHASRGDVGRLINAYEAIHALETEKRESRYTEPVNVGLIARLRKSLFGR